MKSVHGTVQFEWSYSTGDWLHTEYSNSTNDAYVCRLVCHKSESTMTSLKVLQRILMAVATLTWNIISYIRLSHFHSFAAAIGTRVEVQLTIMPMTIANDITCSKRAVGHCYGVRDVSRQPAGAAVRQPHRQPRVQHHQKNVQAIKQQKDCSFPPVNGHSGMLTSI